MKSNGIGGSCTAALFGMPPIGTSALPAAARASKNDLQEQTMTDRPVPPVAKIEPARHKQLGRSRTDDYAWMKDDNWREVLRDPSAIKSDVKAYLEAENAYAKAMLGPTEALQAAMFQEMKGRIKEDDSSVPTPDGPWDYYVRYQPGAQHPLYARRPRGRDEGEQVLLDADADAKGKAFFQVIAAEHSPDHAPSIEINRQGQLRTNLPLPK
jgi:oligopeptidase B